MTTKSILALDLRCRPVRLAEHGNRWEWFADRGIQIVKVYGAKLPEGLPVIRALPDAIELARYADDLNIDRQNVIYVSDNDDALLSAREKGRFSCIAIDPAHAELGNIGATSCSTTADLVGLVILLLEKLKPRRPDVPFKNPDEAPSSGK